MTLTDLNKTKRESNFNFGFRPGLFLTVLILACLVTGCADATTDSQYVGVWHVSDAAMDGESYSGDEFSGIVIVLSKGGSATVSIDENQQAATWKKTSKGVDITMSNGNIWKLSGLSPTLKLALESEGHYIDITFTQD